MVGNGWELDGLAGPSELDGLVGKRGLSLSRHGFAGFLASFEDWSGIARSELVVGIWERKSLAVGLDGSVGPA